MLATRERFSSLCLRIGAKYNLATGRTIDATYDELVNAYTGPNRHYHNLAHIDEGLGELDEVKHLALDPDALEMAWWWHDFVYNIPAKDNELLSAVAAFKTLSELSVPSFTSVKVLVRIMPTLHSYIPNYFDDWLMVDIDLVRIAAPPELFIKNSEDIRQEYGASIEEFRVGQAEFFRNFIIGRSSVYLTDYFRNKYESRAQENIKRVLATFRK